jgi:hypothetical protein
MSILYPLTINGNIPAFYAEQGYFSVPFTINRASSRQDIIEVFATIKTISNSSFIINNLSGRINTEWNMIYFDLTEEFLNRIFPG